MGPVMRLAIFKVNQLGDNVIYLPVVQHLRREFPAWDITVLTSPVAEPLYTVACPGVRTKTFQTAEFNGSWRKPWKLPAFVPAVRSLHPHLCLLGDDQGNVAHLLARLSGADITVGPLIAERHLGRLLHHRISLDDEHSIARQNWLIASGLLERLGKAPLSQDIPPPNLSAFGAESHGRIVIHSGASLAEKRWPLERFGLLANRLAETHPVSWIEQGWAGEQDALSPAVRRFKPGSLDDFIRHMAGAKLFIGNNSGPMNIASSLGIPGVIVNGSSPPRWDPVWHREKFTVLRDDPVGKGETPRPAAGLNWTVDAVHEVVQQALAK